MQIEHFAHRRGKLVNLVHTWLLVGGSLALFVACAWMFFGPDGIAYAAIAGAVSLFLATRISPQMVLRMYKAQPVGPQQFAVGHQILEALAARAGLRITPKIYVLPSRMMNAFAVGRPEDSAICLTDQLIRSMSQRELAGIMAHEISHIRNEDIRVMAIADMVSRFTSILSTFGIVSLLFNLPSIIMGGGLHVPWLAVLLLIFAPTIGGLLQMALSRTREYDADLGAVMLTGDPDGLAMALAKLERAQGRQWESMMLPGGRIPDPSLLRTHPRTQDRIARLMALKATGAGQPTIGGEPPSRKAPSPVPRIARTHPALSPWIEGEGHGEPASPHSLNAPRGGPRMRMRGGVYW